MDKALVEKMIQRTLKQYQIEATVVTFHDFDQLYKKIMELKNKNPI